MSEYQYYEFRAIDKPLDKKAMAELRGITSRGDHADEPDQRV